MDRLPTSHLLQAARKWMFSTQHKWYVDTMLEAMNLLKNAAARGDDESAWLLEKLQSVGGVYRSKYLWIDAAMMGEDSPRANYYRGRAFRHRDELHSALRFLRRSAEAGFAPAMIEMANFGATDQVEWIRKAVDLDDPTGWFKLGPMRFDDLCRAAERGHVLSHKILSSRFFESLSKIEVAVLKARYVLLSRDGDYVGQRRYESVQEKFVMGRELEGYEVFWGPHHGLHKRYQKCIRIYLDITERARRAALQTTFGLREILGRDVARMIGRMVYETRGD